MMKKITTPLLLLCVGICFGMIATKSCSKIQTGILTEIVKTDTLIVRQTDTIRVVQPVPYKVIQRDTIEVIKEVQSGTLFVHEIKQYADSCYTAQISGINANLDFIEVYPRNTIQYINTVEKAAQKPKKWGLGISAGYCFTGRFQPYIGVGITYNVIQW